MDVLANWLWQGSAVALAATAILRPSRRMSATTRYHLWWVTLSVVLVMPLVPWLLSAQDPGVVLEDRAVAGEPAAHAAPAATSVVLPMLPGWSLSLLALAWSAWATVSLSRTLAALVTLRRAKRVARPFPEAREARLPTWLSLRARGRRARLAVSDDVRTAAVLGLTSPSIVVAPSVLGALSLGGLNDEELDQIVVHEWAHVQRRDDVARLVQRVIVAVAGLHPAVWWIDRQLHLERETACDDWAVNATGSARRLAVCLTKLAALPGRPSDAVLLPAALVSSELTTRVVRLLDGRRNTSTMRTLGAPMLVAPALGALGLVIASVELVVTSPIVAGAPNNAVSAGSASAASAAHPALELAVDRGGSGLPVRKSQGSAPAPARTRAQAVSLPDSAQRHAPLALGAGGVGSTIQQNQEGQQRAVLGFRPADEGQLGALPGPTTPVPGDVTPAPVGGAVVHARSQPGKSPTPWEAAAGAGVTAGVRVGKGSQKAAAATAGFFTRLSKSITGVF